MALSALVAGTAGCATVAAAPKPIVVSAAGSLTSTELSDLLPRELTFSDSMGGGQIADLPRALSISDPQPVSGYSSGDLLYWPSEQRLVIPRFDGKALPAGGLILLGHITAGLDYLDACARSCSVRLDPVGGIN